MSSLAVAPGAPFKMSTRKSQSRVSAKRLHTKQPLHHVATLPLPSTALPSTALPSMGLPSMAARPVVALSSDPEVPADLGADILDEHIAGENEGFCPSLPVGEEFYTPGDIAQAARMSVKAVRDHCRRLFPNHKRWYRWNYEQATRVLRYVMKVRHNECHTQTAEKLRVENKLSQQDVQQIVHQDWAY